MNIQFLKAACVSLLLIVMPLAVSAPAQELYLINFSGTSSTLDPSGNEVSRRLSNNTLIRQWASRAGVSNFNHLVLALHRNVDLRGDAIQVVNRKDGSSVTTVFPLFFPESASFTTSQGTTERRFAYVYNLYHSEFSRGTVILNQQTMVNKRGQTNRFLVNAEIQWYEVPEGTNGLRINSGKFKVGKRLQ